MADCEVGILKSQRTSAGSGNMSKLNDHSIQRQQRDSALPINLDSKLLSEPAPSLKTRIEVENVSPTTTVCPERPSPPHRKDIEKSEPQFPQEGSNISSREGAQEWQSTSWIPSIIRAGPLIGLCAITFSILQIFGSYTVLKTSDGDATTNWKYQPTVYLAILTAISNKALAFAMIQGTVITFWYVIKRCKAQSR